MLNKEQAKSVLASLPNIKADLDLFYNYHSNKIENNALTYGETITVLKDGFGVAKPLKDIHDMQNHNKALQFVYQLVELNERLSLRIIREIQSLVEPDRTGFRQNLVEILNTDVKTAEPFEISARLDKLITKYEQSDKPLFDKIADFHIEFERIHPFQDGNGRTGRLLLNLELMKDGYPLTAIKFEDRPSYYEAFNLGTSAMSKLIEKSVTDTFELIEKKQFELNLSKFNLAHNKVKEELVEKHLPQQQNKGIKF